MTAVETALSSEVFSDPMVAAFNSSSFVDDDDEVLDEPFFEPDPEPTEPAAIEYLEACADLKCVKCSQWQRACISRATDVNLCHYGLQKRGVVPMSRSLALHAHIQTLDLGDNGLGPEGVATVLEALHSARIAPSLRMLSLRQNQAGETGAEALRALLSSQGGHPLDTIDFGCNALGTKGGEIVAEGLLAAAGLHEAGAEGASRIASLSLEYNELDDADKLATALKASPTLTHLSLEWNQLGPSAVKALADALATQPPLTSLNVGWNGLGDGGIKELSHALELLPVESPLRHLRLHHNRMSVESSVPLSRALGALHSLDVSGNALGASGAAVLLLAQQELRLRPDDDAEPAEDAEPAAAAPARCTLVMEDVCVRPDTLLAGLLLRASQGEALSHDELERGNVIREAAPVLAAAAPPPKPARGKSAGKGGKAGGAKGAPDKTKWMRNDEEAPPGAKPKASARKGK